MLGLSELLDFPGLLPGLELPALVDFLLQHVLDSFVLFGFAHHSRPFLGPDVPF